MKYIVDKSDVRWKLIPDFSVTVLRKPAVVFCTPLTPQPPIEDVDEELFRPKYYHPQGVDDNGDFYAETPVFGVSNFWGNWALACPFQPSDMVGKFRVVKIKIDYLDSCVMVKSSRDLESLATLWNDYYDDDELSWDENPFVWVVWMVEVAR